jgi:hypothetical protein
MRIPGAFLFIGAMLMTVSCVDIPKYDFKPKIEFVGIDKFVVSDEWGDKTQVRITLSFEDGDGDLGEDAQSDARQNYLKENGGWGNYHVEVFRLVNDKWEKFETSLLDFLIFPTLKTDGVRGPIRGKLDYDLDFAMGSGTKLTPVKFLIKVRDRELRESNVVETDSISIPLFDDL